MGEGRDRPPLRDLEAEGALVLGEAAANRATLRAWWRTTFRVLAIATLFTSCALLVGRLLPALGWARLNRAGHLARAALVTTAHVPLICAVAVSVAALLAARRTGHHRARAITAVLLAVATLVALDLSWRIRLAAEFETAYPRLGWCPGPGGWRTRGPGTINPQGFRGRAETPARAAGRRVVCLGDSFTFGDDVGDDDAWTSIAERRAGVPFVNAGVDAYGIDQMATLYTDQIAGKLDHTDVVVAAILDDGYRACERHTGPKRRPTQGSGADVTPVPAVLRVWGVRLAPESPVLRPWLRTATHLGAALGVLPDHEDQVAAALARIQRAAGPARRTWFLAIQSEDMGDEQLRSLRACGERAGWSSAAVSVQDSLGPTRHPDAAGNARIAEALLRLLGPMR